MKKIVFFVQTKKAIGGSQIQFLDFASYIADHFSYETYYINHPHPIVEEKYKGSKIRFVDIDNCDYSQFEDAVFFTPINYLFYLLVKIEKLRKARIYLYVYHPDVLNWLHVQIYNWRKRDHMLDPLYQLLIDTKSYCFMDLSNYLSMKRRVAFPWEERYLPVTIHSEGDAATPIISSCCSGKNDPIRVGWMGRLDNDKIFSVLNAADNMMKYDEYSQIDFHLIGDGNAKQKISIKKYSPKIRFVFTSYLYGEERDNYIKNNVDLMIAMGISAIDSALLGVPTIIPIVSNKPFWSDIFVPIQNINKYSLGWNIQDNEKMGCVSFSLRDVINEVYDGKKEILGKEARTFCMNEFSLSRASEMLIDQLESTELTVEKCLGIKPVRRQLADFKLYKTIRPMREYPDFHEFVARVNRIDQKRPAEKIKYVLSKSINRVHKKTIRG